MTLDTKKITALLRATELGSLSAAAEELGYTQSGLTHMMNALEDEMGLSLLVRSKTGVKLSPAGHELLPYMEALSEAAEGLSKNINEIRERYFSTIRIGAYSSIARTWLPPILENYRHLSPDTVLSYSTYGIKEQYDAVRADELDLAIVSYEPSLMSGMNWTLLGDDELVAILPGSYSAEEGPFPVEFFSGMEFLMPSAGFDMDILPVFSGLSQKQMPIIRYTNMEDAAIVSMVSHGLGVSILSRLIMESMPKNVAVVPLAPRAYRKLGIITKDRRQTGKAVKSFIACAKETLNSIGE